MDKSFNLYWMAASVPKDVYDYLTVAFPYPPKVKGGVHWGNVLYRLFLANGGSYERIVSIPAKVKKRREAKKRKRRKR